MNLLKQLTFLLIISIIIATSVAPADALSFESQLSTSIAPRFIAKIELKDTRVPQYGFSQTAVALAQSNPVTQKSQLKDNPTLLALAVPTDGSPVVLQGEASFYSRAGCLGCFNHGIADDGLPVFKTATGEVLNDNALTMAIGADKKHLVGHKAKVTSLVTGKSVEVRINDTGGFYQEKYGSRVADLTVATKQAIGMRGGVGQVKVEIY